METPAMIKIAKHKTLRQQLEENPLKDDEFDRHLIDHKASLARRGIDFDKFVETYNHQAKRNPNIQLGDKGLAIVREILGAKVEKRDYRKYYGILGKNHHARIDVDAEIAERAESDRQAAIMAEQNRTWREKWKKEQTEKIANMPHPNLIQEMAKTLIQPEETKRPRLDYSDYLQSDQWKLIRKLVLERDKWHCRTCGARNNLQVHHWTYERIGNENLDDLTTLCAECHELISKNVKLKRF